MVLSDRKILVFGGSGFVGTRLIDIIGEENCINIDKNQSLRYNLCTRLFDIREMKFITEISNSSDIVVLLDAEHHDDVSPVSLYYDVNVDGTRNVLNAMDQLGIKKIIFTSSVAVYGLNKNDPGEEHPADPFNHYGKSKLQAEFLLKEWYNKNPTERTLIIIRPTVIFGERNRGNVYNLLRQIASGKFMMVGSGKNKKSMAYVGNVAAFIKYWIENCKPGLMVFNYVDKPDLNMNELISLTEKTMGKKLPAIRLPYWLAFTFALLLDQFSKITGRKFAVSSVRVKKFCATTQFNSEKAYNSGFKPYFTLIEALKRTIHYEFMDHEKDGITYFSE